jgi:hypothetical protein
MNYEEMTHNEINRAVEIIIKPMSDGGTLTPDYCNNPSDAWPIIVENEIEIGFYADGGCDASCFNGDTNVPTHYWEESRKTEVLRAAMIVFLKMKEDENNG